MERQAAAVNRAALITYHDLQRRVVEGTGSAPMPAWARAVQRVASALSSVSLKTVLMTNVEDSRVDSIVSHVERVDLLALSALGRVPPRALCGLKATALLHGWRRRLLPEQVLVLDHDVAILRPTQLLHMFDPLAYYDLAGVMEGVSRGWDGSDTRRRNDSLATPPDPAGRGWEVNTGVLAVRQQAQWLVQLWAAEFRAGVGLYGSLTGVDQSALMWVLAHEPRARLFPMPPTYNFRAPALYSADLPSPAAFHSRLTVRGAASGRGMLRVVHAAAAELERKISGHAAVKAHTPVRVPATRASGRVSSRRVG